MRTIFPSELGRNVMEDTTESRCDVRQTETFLLKRSVPLNYSVTDLAADNATLEKILPRP